MAYHVHHHHARAPVIGEWHKYHDNQFMETVVQVVTVIAGQSDDTSSAQPTFSRQNGVPLANTRAATTTSSSVSVNPYSAPSRQHIPSPISSSSAVVNAFAAPSTTSSDSVALSTSSAALEDATSKILAPQTTLVSSKIQSNLLVASSSSPSFSSFDSAAPAAATSGSVSQITQSSGMSGGAKAGLAFGILIMIGLMAGLVFFCVRRKKNSVEDHQRLDDEKVDMHKKSQSVASHVSVRRSETNAPRLSLRPVTQMFMPMSEKQDANSALAARTRTPTPEPLSRSPPAEPSNPFGDHAAEKAMIATPPQAATSSVPSSNSSDRTLSGLSDKSRGSDGQPFPVAVAGSRRNSPPGPGPNNVHRVQLDFKPSMEDELELRAGALVRMLHEYDDGWALCIRLDRSQQGVVPRTCISKLPVKPRAGPPPAGAMRGPPPQGRPRGPSNAPGPRMPPNGPGPRGPPPNGRMRSQSNAPRQHRPQSPAQVFAPQQGRPRANSDAISAGRVSQGSAKGSPTMPSQASLPTRKPVPGQAL